MRTYTVGRTQFDLLATALDKLREKQQERIDNGELGVYEEIGLVAYMHGWIEGAKEFSDILTEEEGETR